MARLFAFQYRGVLAAVSAALALFYMLVLFPAASERSGSSANNVLDLQKAHNTAMFVAVLRQWSASNVRAVAIMKQDNIVRLDSSFPIVYALAFAFSYAWLTGRTQPSRVDRVLFAIPFAAAAFDYVENTLHLFLLRGIDTRQDVERAVQAGAFDDRVVFAASASAHVKYLLIGVSAIGLLAAVVGRVRGR